MKLSDKEALKVLAEAVTDNCFQSVGIKYCRFCNQIVNHIDKNHEPDCPVLLAEEILNETK